MQPKPRPSPFSSFSKGFAAACYVTFEEGTWPAWLYDLLKLHVTKIVVCNPRRISYSFIELTVHSSQLLVSNPAFTFTRRH